MNTINLSLYNTLRKELNLSEEKSQNVAKSFQDAILDGIAEKEAAAKELVSNATKGAATIYLS